MNKAIYPFLKQLFTPQHPKMLLSSRGISQLLYAIGISSLLIALAGAVQLLDISPSHIYTLMIAMLFQFISGVLVFFFPNLAYRVLTINLAGYLLMIAVIILLNPSQEHVLFTALFPVMAAFLLISISYGLLLTIAALGLIFLTEHSLSFAFNYLGFVATGALISYALTKLIYQLLKSMEQNIKQLKRLAAHDALTGALDRQGIMKYGDALVAAYLRNRQPLTLALIDLDYFKHINDTYGHEAGDQVLRQVIQRLHNTFSRRADLIGRLGGDELLLILPDTTLSAVCHKLEQFARQLQLEPPTYYDAPMPVALCAGVVSLTPAIHFNLGDLINDADQLVYRAKDKGRSRICCQNDKCISIPLSFAPPTHHTRYARPAHG